MIFGGVNLESNVSFVAVSQGAGVVLWSPFEIVEFVYVYRDLWAHETWVDFSLVFGENQMVDMIFLTVFNLWKILIEKVHPKFDCNWEIFTFDNFIDIIVNIIFCWCFEVIAFWIDSFLKFFPSFTLG